MGVRGNDFLYEAETKLQEHFPASRPDVKYSSHGKQNLDRRSEMGSDAPEHSIGAAALEHGTTYQLYMFPIGYAIRVA